MTLTLVIFYFFVASALAGAVAILFSKNIFKAALWLLVCLLSVAAIFVMSFAEFVAIAQVLIYAGGVLIVILFGIMFTSKLNGKALVVEHTNLFSGTLGGVLLTALLFKLIIHQFNGVLPKTPMIGNPVKTVGTELVSDYAFPFEVVGLLLLVTLVGASVESAFMKTK